MTISIYSLTDILAEKKSPAANISYPSSAAAVVFGVQLSAQTVYRLDRKSPSVRPCV